MTAAANILDPAPRRYASGVSLVRRLTFDQSKEPAATPEEVENWLLGASLGAVDLHALHMTFSSKLRAAGLGVERTSLHIGTLHPQLIGYAWNWSIRDGICDEIQVDMSSLDTDAYQKNPIARVVQEGVSLRFRSDDPDPAAGPLVRELFAEGHTEYVILPLTASDAAYNSISLASAEPGGFSDAQYAAIERLLKVYALLVDRHIAARVSENIAISYLGAGAGRLVHQGQIHRGDGTSIPAVIWVSDLRNFTSLSDTLSDEDIIALLNAYFAAMAQAVMDHGGEVLKFIGDGLLAVFRLEDFANPAEAARSALAAAKAGLAAVEQLNGDPDALPGVSGWRPLRSGVALHKGEVFFGNIGATNRLDFTVIGSHVNLAARVEAMCKTLGKPLLVTAPVANLVDAPLEDMGPHSLRGLAEPIGLFAPA